MSLPLVSVVTVFHNRGHAVEGSLRSLLAQTYVPLEIIAVDDGSSDDTHEQLSRISDPRLTVFTQTNRGFVQTMIETIASARGEVIAVHGSGDLSAPARIARQMELLGAERLGVVGCHVEHHDPLTRALRVSRNLVSRSATAQLLEHNPFAHGEVLFRREPYERVGGYRPFFTYAQDRDLWLRMSAVTEFGMVPEVLYRRFRRADGASVHLEKRLLQRYLSAFAVQCMRMRLHSGHDWVDLYGEHAGFFRDRSAQVAEDLLPIAVRALEAGDLDTAVRVNRLSRAEHRGLRNGALAGALGLAQTPLGRAALLRAIKARRGWQHRSRHETRTPSPFATA